MLFHDLLSHQYLGAPVYTVDKQKRVKRIELNNISSVLKAKKFFFKNHKTRERIISSSAHLSFRKSQQHSFLFLIPFHHLHSQECCPVMG